MVLYERGKKQYNSKQEVNQKLLFLISKVSKENFFIQRQDQLKATIHLEWHIKTDVILSAPKKFAAMILWQNY